MITKSGSNPAASTEGATDRPAVMIVEDDYLLARELCALLKEMPARPIGPFARIADAGPALARTTPDAAVLDVKLAAHDVFALADRLDDMQVPLVFVTGFEKSLLPERFAAAPYLAKPVDPGRLSAVLRSILGRRG